MTPKPPRRKPLTPEQVRVQFKKEGKTVKQWALDNGYDPNRVYRVLGGLEKSLYGKSHEIAVKLGIKVAAEPDKTADE